MDPAGRFLPVLVEPVDPAAQVDSEQADSAVQAWVAAQVDSVQAGVAAKADSAQVDSVWLALVAADCRACPALPAGWKAALHSVAGCYSVVEGSPEAESRDGPARPLAWKSGGGGSQVWVAGS